MSNFVKGAAIAIREDRNYENGTRKVVVITHLHFRDTLPTIIEIYQNRVEVWDLSESSDLWSYDFEDSPTSFIEKYQDGYFDPSMQAYNERLDYILRGMWDTEVKDLMKILDYLERDGFEKVQD